MTRLPCGSEVQKPSLQIEPMAHCPSDLQAPPMGTASARDSCGRSSAATSGSSSRRRITLGRHLPFAVLQHQANLGRFDVFALGALHLEGGGAARDLGALDLELHAFDFLLHLLQVLAAALELLR